MFIYFYLLIFTLGECVYLNVSVFTMLLSGACGGQKRYHIFLEAGVTGGCEQPRGCQESNVGPLQGQQMF